MLPGLAALRFQHTVVLQEQVGGKCVVIFLIIKKLLCLIQSFQMLNCLQAESKPYLFDMKQSVDKGI